MTVLAERRLIVHPRYTSPVVSIDCNVSIDPTDRLRIDYCTRGNIGELCIPRLESPQRSDNLWQYTCFELFVALENGAYLEYNFAPSTHYAAYQFARYREEMLPSFDAPVINITVQNDGATELVLTAIIDIAQVARHMTGQIGLSAVIEQRDATLSYWALAHPQAAPNFHHSDCFALTLSAFDAR